MTDYIDETKADREQLMNTKQRQAIIIARIKNDYLQSKKDFSQAIQELDNLLNEKEFISIKLTDKSKLLVNELKEQSMLMVNSTDYRLGIDRVKELTTIVNCVNNFVLGEKNSEEDLKVFSNEKDKECLLDKKLNRLLLKIGLAFLYAVAVASVIAILVFTLVIMPPLPIITCLLVSAAFIPLSGLSAFLSYLSITKESLSVPRSVGRETRLLNSFFPENKAKDLDSKEEKQEETTDIDWKVVPS